MTWQYRVMRNRRQSGRKWAYHYAIHEVYDGGKGWTQDAMRPRGDTLEELKSDYDYMAEAFRHPVLDYKTGKPISDKSLPEKEE